MNCFNFTKAILFCVSLIGTCSIFYFYSTRPEFKAEISRRKDADLVAPAARKSSDSQILGEDLPEKILPKRHTEAVTTLKPKRLYPKIRTTARSEKVKLKKHAKDDFKRIQLARDVTLELQGSKSEKWTEEAWKMVADELKWSNRTGIQRPDTKRNISTYTAKCGQSSKKKPTRSLNSLLFVEDSPVDEEQAIATKSVAVATLPCLLYVNRSTIFGARRGVFPRVQLPRGLIFGHYKGEYIATVDTNSMQKSSYAWALGMTQEGFLYVDAKDENKSNWLRFVNSARFEQEQNVYPLYLDGQIYYLLYKDVPAHTELLVWYGKYYGTQMGIWFLSNSTGTGSLAPPRSLIVCPTCRGLPPVEDVEKQTGDEDSLEKD